VKKRKSGIPAADFQRRLERQQEFVKRGPKTGRMSTYICPRYERVLRRQELEFRPEEGVILIVHRHPKAGVEELLDINWTVSGAAAGYRLPGDYWQKAAIGTAARKLANVATYGTPTGPQPAKVPMKAPVPAAASLQEQLAAFIPQLGRVSHVERA
jgi:hypothetical protein